ncbi:hypothetical protein BVG79_01012 [Ketogulonicigenium robustum]|uniref:NIF system FeS cluster assembly NifU N-terminal domain-containing protein n=1 Tax=Ketogulonicigenium robustum TaxID=92947 RepID=A0A1W6NYN5_9RHOB|nr:iron-sulfur cluster assembly scaffold protein [Ketogulonicigenium robustum]ARO14358.1 hypothetical protein BVG79_01012 [Ketogulonicigenium robustum]
MSQPVSSPDLSQIYSPAVLTAAADIPHLGRLTAPMASAQLRAPVCGSQIAVTVDVTDGRVTAFAQEVKACALGQAAASLFGDIVIGLTPTEVAALRGQMAAMLRDGAAAPTPAFEILRAAASLPERHGAMLLVFDATLAALAQITPKA